MREQNEPLFKQVALLIENSIIEGVLAPGSRAPSSNELADFHQINPATARKGLSLLVGSGVLAKRRGVGMFVTDNAIELILAQRKEAFAEGFVVPLIDEAALLNMSRSQLHNWVEAVAVSRGLYA